jgi:Papain-like cysteine protease AvrRpt2
MASIVTAFSSAPATATRRETTRRAWRYLAALVFAAGLVVGAPPTTSRAAGNCDSHDRLCGIAAIPEADLNWTSCAQSSVVMLLEALGQVPGDTAKAKMQNVEKFVQQGGYTGDDGKIVPLGHNGNTNSDQLLNTKKAADSFGIPVTSATWSHASPSDWLSELRSKVNDQGDLAITLLPSSKALWTTEKVDSGHYLVVSGITDDGQVITHDPIDGQTHIRTADAFQQAWGTNKPWASPYQYLDVVPGHATTPPAAGALPGGIWIAPADGSQNPWVIDAAVHAYPAKTGDPAIDHVDFTIWWPELGPKTGPWKTACSITKPTSGDQYDCPVDPGNLGAPVGKVWLSFDVFDKAGGSTLSPNGERAVEWTVPKDVVGGDAWETYQGDGYIVDYPGAARTESVPSSQSGGIYSATASYYSEGPDADPQLLYMVEHYRFAFPLGFTGLDYTALLKETLSFYSLTSNDASATPKDVTIDGRSGLLMSLRGNGVTGEFEVLVTGADLYMIITAHKTTDNTLDSQRFFDSFHLR